MVECESWSDHDRGDKGTGFNRYMVECESERYFKRLDFTNSFNRYMVECELQDKSNYIKDSKRF